MASDLSPDTESFIQQEVAVGAFQSRQDVLEAGVALLKQRRALMNRLAESRRQLNEGEYVEFNEAGLRVFFDELIDRADRRAKSKS